MQERLSDWWYNVTVFGEIKARTLIFFATSAVLIIGTFAIWLLLALLLSLVLGDNIAVAFGSLFVAMAVAGEMSRTIDRWLRMLYLRYDD